MVLHQFPDLQWLKDKAEKNFSDRQGWQGRKLPTGGWPTVILNAKAQNIYRDNIRGPLSIFTNLSGESFVEVEKRKVNVKEGLFFVSNHDQYYTLGINPKQQTETLNIHFGEYFADQVFQALQKKPEALLEDEAIAPFERLEFYNTLYIKDEYFDTLTGQLKNVAGNILLEEEILYALLGHLLRCNTALRKNQEEIPALKKSTQAEIMKRLLVTADYIYTAYNKDLSLDELAKVSCLSKFHFLRLFKIAFRQTPHQFVNQVRIKRGKELLKNSNLEVNAIARLLGFADASSFSRMFYNYVGAYPTQYRAVRSEAHIQEERPVQPVKTFGAGQF